MRGVRSGWRDVRMCVRTGDVGGNALAGSVVTPRREMVVVSTRGGLVRP